MKLRTSEAARLFAFEFQTRQRRAAELENLKRDNAWLKEKILHAVRACGNPLTAMPEAQSKSL